VTWHGSARQLQISHPSSSRLNPNSQYMRHIGRPAQGGGASCPSGRPIRELSAASRHSHIGQPVESFLKPYSQYTSQSGRLQRTSGSSSASGPSSASGSSSEESLSSLDSEEWAARWTPFTEIINLSLQFVCIIKTMITRVGHRQLWGTGTCAPSLPELPHVQFLFTRQHCFRNHRCWSDVS